MEHFIDLSGVPGRVILAGVGGSHAYGLSHSTSDYDFRGCYVVPTRSFFGLSAPQETHDSHDPDMAFHEAGKLLRLLLGANPTCLELLWYEDYVIKDEIGQLLIDNRNLFLSEKIRATHAGFAMSQLNRLQRREDDGTLSAKDPKKIAKHARHLLRLIQQAERALTTGIFDIKAANRDEIFAFGELPYHEMVATAQIEVNRLKEVSSVLPPEPDVKAIDDLLVHIRTVALDW